jgi:PilZ domain
MTTEKRRFERYVFPNDDNITALLASDDGNKSFEARVLNISKGGLGLAVNRTNIDNVTEDTVLFLKEVTGEKRITRLTGHAVKVKWILDYKPLNNLALGCEFVALNNECLLEIEALLRLGTI